MFLLLEISTSLKFLPADRRRRDILLNETPIINLYRLFVLHTIVVLHDDSTRSTLTSIFPFLHRSQRHRYYSFGAFLWFHGFHASLCLPPLPIPSFSILSTSLSWSAALFVVTFIPLTFRSLHHPRYRITPLFPTPLFLVLLHVSVSVLYQTYPTPPPLPSPLTSPVVN